VNNGREKRKGLENSFIQEIQSKLKQISQEEEENEALCMAFLKEPVYTV
jgi:primosomal protein N''